MKYISILLILFATSSAFAQTLYTRNDSIPITQDSVTIQAGAYRGNIQWQKSLDNTTWINLAGKNVNTLKVKPDTEAMYRAMITEGTCLPIYSDTASIVFTVPEVSTSIASGITSNSVLLGGNVNSTGGTLLLEQGLCYSISPNPTTADSKVIIGNGLGSFNNKVSGLLPNTTYYARAYAINSHGTAYGEEGILTTYINENGCKNDFMCCQLFYSHLAIESLDLKNVNYKKVNDFLYEVDRNNAYHVFVRDPEDFLMWSDLTDPEDILSLVCLDASIHETNHMIDSDLKNCDPFLNRKYLFFGNVYITDLTRSQTENYSIVEETIAENLKFHDRYKTYIEGAKGNNGNDFGVLLDELNSYTGGGWFFIKYIQSGLLPKISGNQTIDSGLGGMVNFMVYLENYLMVDIPVILTPLVR